MKWILIVVIALVGIVALVAIIGALLPKRHVVTRRATFHQTPEAIWEVISGPPNWRPDVKGYEELPPRDGRKVWYEVDNHGQKITYERVEFVPPKTLVTRIADPKLPFGGSWSHRIEPAAGGTMLTITEDGEVYNPIFRFMSRFVFGHSATIEGYLNNLGQKFGEKVSIQE